MPSSLSQTSPSEWKYISEGAATVVFSYHGPHHPIFTRRVLRLRKVLLGQPRLRVSDDDPVAFQQAVLSRLLDPSFLPDLQSIPLQSDWVEALSNYHESSRPQERRSTGAIDCSRQTGVLATDLISELPCAVEVKPKCGFLPNCHYLSPASKSIKAQTCRTCMHAHLKRIEGRNAAMEFCPLDLFSGSKVRLERAFDALWDSWVQSNGSINNLRIFSRGKMVLPNDESALQAWSRENFSLPADASLTTIKSHFMDTLLPKIYHTPLLGHISTLQRSLDPLDCEGLAKLIEMAPGADLTQPSIEDWVSFVETYSSKRQEHSSFSPSNLRFHILSYVLSAVFKDCSLIVPFTSYRADNDNNGIKVIDLDIKRVEKIPVWFELDKMIVKEYAKLETGMRKRCVE